MSLVQLTPVLAFHVPRAPTSPLRWDRLHCVFICVWFHVVPRGVLAQGNTEGLLCTLSCGPKTAFFLKPLPPCDEAAAEVGLCVPCAVGNFSDQLGVSSCQRCPEGCKKAFHDCLRVSVPSACISSSLANTMR